METGGAWGRETSELYGRKDSVLRQNKTILKWFLESDRSSIRRVAEAKESLLSHGGVGVWGTGTVGVGLAGVLNTGSHVSLSGEAQGHHDTQLGWGHIPLIWL